MFKRKFLFMFFGVLLIGISIGLLRIAALGMDPYTGAITALSGILGIALGPLLVGCNLLLLVIQFFLKRSLIGLGTLFNMVGIGYIVDFMVGIWPVGGAGIPLRILLLLLAIVLLCFSVAMYMTADLGVAPYDAIGMILGERLPGSFRVWRIALDCTSVLCTIALTLASGQSTWALVGVGTVATALLTGPLVQWFRTRLTDPWLEKSNTGL